MNTDENIQRKETYDFESSCTAKMVLTEDFREAVSSFQRKRKPVFKARQSQCFSDNS